jgi:hypothetical protein
MRITNYPVFPYPAIVTLRALAILSFLAAATHAATLDVTGGSLTYTAGANVNNNLTISVSGSNYVFNDTAETIDLTPGAQVAECNGGGTNVITCPVAGVTQSFTVNLLTGADQLNLNGPIGLNGNTVYGPVTLQSGQDITLNSNSGILSFGNVTLTANTGAITEAANASTGSNGTLTATAATGVALNGTNDFSGVGGGTTASGDFNIFALGSLSVSSSGISSAGNVTLTSQFGGISISSSGISSAGNVTLTSAEGTISESGIGIITANLLTANTAVGVTLNSPNAVNQIAGAVTQTGNFSFTNRQALTIAPAGISTNTVSSSSVTLTASNGNITLDGSITVAPPFPQISNVTLTANKGGIYSAGGSITCSLAPNLAEGEPAGSASLALSASSGIGSSGAPLVATVPNLVAQNTASGGIFLSINAASPGPLTIGFTGDPFQGVIDSGAAGDQIVLTNAGTVNVTTNTVANEIVSAPGNVTVSATGAAANLATGESQNGASNQVSALRGSIVSTAGTVSLTAGQDLLLGNTAGTSLSGHVLAGGNIVLNAGRNIALDDQSAVFASAMSANPGATITATASSPSVNTAVAGGNVSIAHTAGKGAYFQTQGGAIALTAGAGGAFSADGGNANGDVVSNGGNITISADSMTLTDSPSLVAGSGTVTLRQVSAAEAINLGTKTTGDLSLLNAEVNKVNANNLVVGAAAATGGIAVSAPIGTAIPTLTLQTAGAFSGSGGSLTAPNLAFNDGSTAAHTWTVSSSSVNEDANAIPISSVTGVTVNGGTGVQTFNATPSASTAVAVNGNVTSLANSLKAGFPATNVNLSVNSTSPYTGLAGTYTFNNGFKTVSFSHIESGVMNPPTIAKAFSASPIALNGTTTLSFTIAHANVIAFNGGANTLTVTGLGGLTNVSFADSLPSGLVVATPPAGINHCGGTLSAAAGSSSIQLVGGAVPLGGSCLVSVTAQPTTAGTIQNQTGAVSALESGPGTVSNQASLVVQPGFTINAPAVTYPVAASVTVTVVTGSSTPAGTVTLTVDSGSPSPQTLSNGAATFNLGVLNAGGHSLSVSYSGNFGNVSETAPQTPTLTVNKAQLTVTANSTSKVYGAPPTFTAAITGFLNSDTSAVVAGTAGFNTTATAASPVGVYPIAPTQGSLSATNYAFSNLVAGTLTVTAAPLTVTANSASKAYGAALPTFSDTITGFVNGDTSAVVSGTAGFNTTATAASPMGGYPVTATRGSLTAGNYTFSSFVNGTLTVTAAVLTVTANNASKVYGAALPAFGDAITGFVNGDTSAVVSGTAGFNTTATAASPVGGYAITPTQSSLSATNYAFSNFVNGTLNVAAVQLTVTANGIPKAYGAALPAFSDTITGFVNGDTSAVVSGTAGFNTSATAASPIGGYPVTPTRGSLTAGNYTFNGFVNGTLTVTAAVLTVTANNASKVYGAALPAFSGTITGFVNSDTSAAVAGTAAFNTTAAAASPVGGYAITPTPGSLSAANYVFSNFVNGTLTVTGVQLTVTANSASKVYGAALPTFTAAITGFVNGDTSAVVSGTAGFSTTATSASPLGTYPIAPTQGSLTAGNYTFNTFVNGTLTATAAGLTVTANNASKVYGAALPAFSNAITGFVNGDTSAVVSGTAGINTTATAASPAGGYPITPARGSLSAGNYTFNGFVNGTLTVTAAGLTVTANNASKVYGAALPAFGDAITGFVNGDTSAVVSGIAGINTTATPASPVGTYPIAPTQGSLTAGNYAFSNFVNGTLTVTGVQLTVTANSASKVYGAALPTFTAAITGFVNGDTSAVVAGAAGFNTTATAASLMGGYPVTPTPGSLTAGNYTFNGFVNGTLTVTAAGLTVTANNASKVYGAALPAYSGTITGFVNGDTSAVVSGIAGFNTTATAASPMGGYPIAPTQGSLSAGNYTFNTFVNGTLTITAAVLTVTANNASKVYGAALPAFSDAITGLVNGDTSAVVSVAPGLTTTATAGSVVGNYPITVSGTPAAGNYTFTFVNGTLSISKASTIAVLTLSGPAVSVTVLVAAPGAGTLTGTVQFLSPTTVLGTVTLAGATASLAISPGTVTAVYSGDGNFTGSTSLATSTFSPATSTLSLGSSANPSTLGQSVTFTASVTTGGGSSGSATGSVQFLDGTKLLGSASLSGGQAAYAIATLAGGSHTIIAQYSGDSIFPAAQAGYGQFVNAPVTLAVTAAPGASVYGQAVVLTATVGPVTAPAGFAAPTGQATFSQTGALAASGSPVGTATLVSGTASATVNTLAVGSDIITAQYSGDSTWPSASRTISVTVSEASTAASLSLTIVSGQMALMAAVTPVAPGAGTPTGLIQFVNTSNNTVAASASLSGGNAMANVAASAAGLPIVAVYAGDGNFKGSTSGTLPIVTNAAANLSSSFAPDEVASLFNVTGLNGDTAATLPLTTSLGGVTVKIADSAGVGRMAELYGVFASAGQINFVIPGATAAGPATVTVTLPGGGTVATAIAVTLVAPGIFTANMSGQGVYAGQVVYASPDGSQTTASSAAMNSATNQYVPNPIDVSTPGNQVFLVLYGTGIRYAVSPTATVNGVNLPVVFWGAQGQYPGLDQVNLQVPGTLAGAGLVNIVITVGGHEANTVTASIQ